MNGITKGQGPGVHACITFFFLSLQGGEGA